jgi:hypothetical protein
VFSVHRLRALYLSPILKGVNFGVHGAAKKLTLAVDITGLQLSTDVSQKMSFAPQFEITNSITAELTRIERARGFLDAAKLSEDWIAGMQKRALVLEAHYTTHRRHSTYA